MAINRSARTMLDHADDKHRPASHPIGRFKSVRSGGLLLSVLFLLTLDACKPKGENPAPGPEVVSAPKPTPLPLPPPPVVPTAAPVAKESATLAVAKFAGEHLQECVGVTISLSGKPAFNGPKWLSSNQIAIILMDDYLLSAGQNRKTKTLLKDAGIGDLLFYAMCYSGRLSMNDKGEQIGELPADLRNEAIALVSRHKETIWPIAWMKPKIEAGELVPLEVCKFPHRTHLGICLIEKSHPNASLRIEHQYYSVSKSIDSDEGLKSCLKLGGKWTAADPSDSAVARERLRQHARKLGDIAQSVGGSQRF